MNKLTLVGVLALGLGLLATGWILQYKPFDHQPTRPQDQAPRVQESMKGVKAWQYDEQGKKTQTLEISAWWQYVGNPTVYMKKPQLEIQHNDGSTWFLTALNGKGRQIKPGQFEDVELLDKVFVSQKKDGVPLELRTEALHYDPNKQWVRSDVPVQVSKEDMHLTANRMFFDMNSKTLKFFGQVTTDYEANQP